MKSFLRRCWYIIPKSFRKPLVFVIGLMLILVSPIIGSIPGPGGIIVFLAGIGILATEFDWAENLKVALVETVPAELKKRWQPTPRWQLVFDATTIALLAGAIVFYLNGFRVPVVSFTATAVAIAAFNRNRLNRVTKYFKRKR